MPRAHRTDKSGPDETPEQLIERIRIDHGDAIARVVAKDLATPPTRRPRRKTVAGFKPVKRIALSQGLVPKQFDGWDERDTTLGPLPRSGALTPPRVVPRQAHRRRRGAE